ncbi:MAG TPA: hypothetical protein VN688_32405 [Gemmataceae bacterium]|nr:hypothetical protein [Gemmataceae bacterium]
MSSSGAEGGAYEIHNSGVIVQAFLDLQRQATREGRGQELLLAARAVYEHLRNNPMEFGEPLYRLPALRMQVRCVAIRPLYVDFAVCEDHPLVFIKAVKLLGGPDS